MKTSDVRRAITRRWPFTVIVIVIAIALAVVIHGSLKKTPTGQATTQILVDSPSSSLVNVNVNSASLTAQASVIAQAMTSQAVLQQVAKAAGVPAGSVSAQGPFNGAGEVLDVPTPSEARSMQLISVKSAYHVAFVAQQNVPIITVTVTGPNEQAAGHVADAVLPGTEAWLSTIASTSTVPKKRQLVLRQLGDAQAGEVNSHTADLIAIIGGVAILLLGLLAVVLFDRRATERRAIHDFASELDGESDPRYDGAFTDVDDPFAARDRHPRFDHDDELAAVMTADDHDATPESADGGPARSASDRADRGGEVDTGDADRDELEAREREARSEAREARRERERDAREPRRGRGSRRRRVPGARRGESEVEGAGAADGAATGDLSPLDAEPSAEAEPTEAADPGRELAAAGVAGASDGGETGPRGSRLSERRGAGKKAGKHR